MSGVSRTFVRKFASAASKEGIEKSAKLWKQLTLFVALPAVALMSINVYLEEKKHLEHWERPPFINYDHLRIHNKNYPWGDGKHGLFFNKKYNCTKAGYED